MTKGFIIIRIRDQNFLSGEIVRVSFGLNHFLRDLGIIISDGLDTFYSYLDDNDVEVVKKTFSDATISGDVISNSIHFICKALGLDTGRYDINVTRLSESATFPLDLYCAIEPKGTGAFTQEQTSASVDLGYIDKINEAVVLNKGLDAIAQLYLSAIHSNSSIINSRLYMFDEDENRLSLIAETFEGKLLKKLEDLLGVKLNTVIPPLQKGDFFHELIEKKEANITSNKDEIKRIIKSHIDRPFLRRFVNPSIELINLRTFGAIPLFVGNQTVGVVTFGANRVLDEDEKKSIIRYTQQVSGALVQKITEKALRSQIKFTSEIFDQLPLDIVIFDKDHKFIYANKQAIPDNELRSWVKGRTGVEYVIKKERDKEEVEQLRKLLKELKEGKDSVQWVTKITDKSGTKRQFLRTMIQLDVEDCKYVVGFGVDVTELVSIQDKLSEAQRIGKIGGWEFNKVTGEIEFSDQALQILRITKSQGHHTLKDFWQALQPLYRDNFIKAISNVGIETNAIEDLEVKLLGNDDEEYHVCINALPVMDKLGNVSKITGAVLDISQRKRLEIGLNENKRLLLATEHMGSIGSWEVNFNDLTDWTKNTTFWSDESYRIFGYRPGSVEVSYPFFLQHVHPEDKHLVSGNFTDWMVPGLIVENDFRIVLNDGTIKHLHGRFFIEYNDAGKPAKMIGITQDITARKLLELKLMDYNKDLEKEVAARTTELQKINKDLDTFNYSISHDLKTPIRAIEVFTSLLKRNANNVDDYSYIDRIDQCVVEMKNMINTLLEFSKFGKVAIKKEIFDVKKLIDGYQLKYKSIVPHTKFVVGETPHIYVDGSLISHVFNNLISNAVKYSSKQLHPRIEIKGIKNSAYTLYSISDNGVGFDMQLSKRLFKPFVKLHSSEEFEGSGAGLAIAERIVAKHGGSIWAESKIGKGATFYVKLPNS